jgi:tRNA threonylcarbamoyladenosine biosynthesis protein TsaB
MRLLAVDAALAGCSAAVLAGGRIVAERRLAGQHAQAALLPALAAAVLEEASIRPAFLDAVAATVGPGSFTGLRASLAFVQGLAQANGAAITGVTVAEALAAAAPAVIGRALWVAIDTGRRGRVFLVADGMVRAIALETLPQPSGPVMLAGDAAGVVAARLAARGADVMLTDAKQPLARDVARVAERRLTGALPPLPAQPLYVDAPEARRPAGGLRPAPRFT